MCGLGPCVRRSEDNSGDQFFSSVGSGVLDAGRQACICARQSHLPGHLCSFSHLHVKCSSEHTCGRGVSPDNIAPQAQTDLHMEGCDGVDWGGCHVLLY